MNITAIQIVKFAVCLMIVACLNISCTEVDKRTDINHQDTIELLNLSLGGKQFNKLFQESRIQNKSVYIALDSTVIRWPKHAGNIKIELITGYNKQPDVFQRGNEKRFVINPPIFEFVNDSATVSVYVFKFHLIKEFNFAKIKDKWVLVSDKEYQY